jgi:hypothetical protein
MLRPWQQEGLSHGCTVRESETIPQGVTIEPESSEAWPGFFPMEASSGSLEHTAQNYNSPQLVFLVFLGDFHLLSHGVSQQPCEVLLLLLVP